MGTGRILTKRGFGTGAARGSVPPVCHLLPSRGSWVRNGSTSESGIGLWLETSPDVFILPGQLQHGTRNWEAYPAGIFSHILEVGSLRSRSPQGHVPLESTEEKASLLASGRSLACVRASPIFTGCSPSGCVSKFPPFYKDTSHVGLGALSIPIWPHLYLITYICSHPFPK